MQAKLHLAVFNIYGFYCLNMMKNVRCEQFELKDTGIASYAAATMFINYQYLRKVEGHNL